MKKFFQYFLRRFVRVERKPRDVLYLIRDEELFLELGWLGRAVSIFVQLFVIIVAGAGVLLAMALLFDNDIESALLMLIIGPISIVGLLYLQADLRWMLKNFTAPRRKAR